MGARSSYVLSIVSYCGVAGPPLENRTAVCNGCSEAFGLGGGGSVVLQVIAHEGLD